MTGLEPADWEPQLRAVADAFRERLDMLEESGQVTALARWMTESTLARISKVFDLTLDEDNAAQFTTHVAMAFSRLQRGEAEAPLSPELAAEVAEHPRQREVVQQIMADCEAVLNRAVPESEIDYLTVHLCALTEPE